MTDEPDVLDELESLLTAVDPSPAFAAGVRARIAARADGRARPWAWRVAIGAGLAVLALAVAWVGRPLLSGGHAAVPAPTQPVRTLAAAGPAAASDAVAGASDPTPASVQSVSSGATSQTVTQRFKLGDDDVVVPDDQRLALIHLLAGVRSGRATVPTAILPVFDDDGLLILPPVVITPLPGSAGADGDDNPGGGPGSRKD